MGFAAGIVGILDDEIDRACPWHGGVELRISRPFAIVGRGDQGAFRIVERKERIEQRAEGMCRDGDPQTLPSLGRNVKNVDILRPLDRPEDRERRSRRERENLSLVEAGIRFHLENSPLRREKREAERHLAMGSDENDHHLGRRGDGEIGGETKLELDLRVAGLLGRNTIGKAHLPLGEKRGGDAGRHRPHLRHPFQAQSPGPDLHRLANDNAQRHGQQGLRRLRRIFSQERRSKPHESRESHARRACPPA